MVNTKRDWLICGRVALYKCNVSRWAISEQLLSPRSESELGAISHNNFVQSYYIDIVYITIGTKPIHSHL